MHFSGRTVSELGALGYAAAGLSTALLVRDQFTRGPEWLGPAIVMTSFAIPICSMILHNGAGALRFRVATGILLATAAMAVVALESLQVPTTVTVAGFSLAAVLGLGSLRRATMRK